MNDGYARGRESGRAEGLNRATGRRDTVRFVLPSSAVVVAALAFFNVDRFIPFFYNEVCRRIPHPRRRRRLGTDHPQHAVSFGDG